MIFAEFPTPRPGDTENFLWVFAALLLIASLLWGFRRRPPIEAEFVTKEEFKEFKNDVDAKITRLFDKLDEAKAEILVAGQRRSTSIHERLNQLEAQAARIDERTRAERD